MGDRAIAGALAACVLAGPVLSSAPSAVQHAVPGSQIPLRILKISAGPAGAVKEGVFSLTEERSIFSRTTDREVIVFFQWEGVPGPHTLVAHWRSPDGAISSTSTLDYVAQDSRFGANWPLSLSPRTPLGTWSVEATVDGQPAGRFTFEIRDERVESAVVRRPLTPAAVYDRLNRAFVVLDRVGHRGQSLEPAGAFALADGRICTSIVALDAVDALRMVEADGTSRSVETISAFDRVNGWAMLHVAGARVRSFGEIASEAPRVGERLFTIDGGVSGGRVLRPGVVSGRMEAQASSGALLVSFDEPGAPPGAPVVNEFGALVGMLGGPPVAGATRMIDLLRMHAASSGHVVIPATSVCVRSEGQGSSVRDLQAAGELVLPMARDEHVVSGGFARGITRSPPAPSAQSEEFSLRDEKFVVFVNWHPTERLRGVTQLRLYDAANKLTVRSETKRSNFRKGEFALSFWELPVPRTAGTYRADVLFDGRPAWRGFVHITR